MAKETKKTKGAAKEEKTVKETKAPAAEKAEKVSKTALIEMVAEAADLSKKDAASAVNATLDKIVELVSEGKVVELKGFGQFGYRVKEARTGRNPQTGDEIEIAEQPVTYAKVGREFKRLVKEAYKPAAPAKKGKKK